MTDLLTRLESGSGNDHQLNIDICEKLGLAPKEYFGSKVTSYSWESGVINTEKARHLDALRPPPILTSLDAALSLVERMLPAWQFTIYHDGAYVSRSDPPSIEWGRAKTPARSLTAALLRALDQEPQR